MEALQIAQQRYSVKKYKTDKKIPEDKIAALKEILRLSPSSINIQPWKFTFVQNREVKAQLAQFSLMNVEKITQADLLVVFSVADDLDAFQEVVDREFPKELQDFYNTGKANMPELDLKVWLSRQVYIALGVGLSGSAALGLDATPMEGIESDKYSEILKMTEYKPILAMAVGYGADDDYNRLEVSPKSRRALEDVIETI